MAGYHKAHEINQEYKVAERVGHAARATYDSAVSLDEKYEIRKKVGETAKSTYTAVVEANEKHKIAEVRHAPRLVAMPCRR